MGLLDCYELLELSRTASAEAIVSSYRRLSRKFHPDVSSSPDAAKRFTELTEAYDVLSDPERRRRYDLTGETSVPRSDSASRTESTDANVLRAMALRQARNGALWVAGGGVVTAVTYIGAAGSYWISWGAILFGGIQSLRGLASYFSVGGRASAGLAMVLGLLVLGIGSSAAVAESEREAGILLAAVDRAVPLRDEARRHTDAVFARTDPWGPTDVQDMLRAGELYAAAAHELDWNLPVLAVSKPTDYGHVVGLGRLYRDRSDLARRIAYSVTDGQRTTLLEEWSRQLVALNALLAEINGDSRASAASSSTPTSTPLTAAARTPTPTLARTPAVRPVTLRPEQLIIPPVEFPLAGYDPSQDAADSATGGWIRTYASATAAARYHFVRAWVVVLGPTESGASLVASATRCEYDDPQGRAVVPRTLKAESVGEGAKACGFRVGADVTVYTYLAGSRNIVIQIMSNPLVQMTDAEAMRDAVRVASAQLAIIDRVAPR